MFLRHPLKRLRPTYVTYFLRFRFDFIYRMSTRKSLDAQHQGFFYGQTCACTMFGAKNSQERFAFRLSLSCQATPYRSANPCVARLVIRSPLPRNPLKETSQGLFVYPVEHRTVLLFQGLCNLGLNFFGPLNNHTLTFFLDCPGNEDSLCLQKA